MRLKEHLRQQEILENLDYETYCKLISFNIDESFLQSLKDKAMDFLMKVFKPIKDVIMSIANDLKIGIMEIVKAFQQRSIFGFLKALRFNLGVLLRAVVEFGKLVRSGLLGIFNEISKTGAIQKLKQGTMKIDEFMDRYPLLKKVAGIAIAGLLIYIWLSMTFIGDFDYDFNWTDIIRALAGSFSITDLFLSPSGLLMITLFMTGGLISVPWLGSSMYNLVMALLYTGYTRLRDKDFQIVNMIKSKIRRG